MEAKLFADAEIEKYLLEVVFHGPSFEGVMEIDALAKEIQGLEDILRSGIHSLKRRKRIDYDNDDLVIYVAAFEKSSFKKRVLIFNKRTGEYQHLIALSGLIIGILAIVADNNPIDLKALSAETIAKIRDEVAIELLQNEGFIKSAAAVVQSVNSEGDFCKFIAPDNKEISITPEISDKIQRLSEPREENKTGEYYEIIQGRINKVDLDASRRHIGFKYNGEGTTIEATFIEKPDNETLKSLLGEWVELKGMVSYLGANRNHIEIQEYEVIKQSHLGFPSEEQE